MQDASRRGGLTVREYERHVWDMAKHQIHPTFVFVAAQVAGATRILDHAAFQQSGGWALEAALFLAGFLGAWACFYSTLLRVSGLKSATVTVLAPTAVLAALAVWFAFPAPTEMSRGQVLAAALLLVVPGVIGWPLTMRRWSAARREAASLLEEEPRK
jgi:cation transport ATPase